MSTGSATSLRHVSSSISLEEDELQFENRKLPVEVTEALVTASNPHRPPWLAYCWRRCETQQRHIDDKYSWFILFTCILGAGLGVGVPLSGGVLADTFITEFNCTVPEAGWVSSLELAALFLSGPLHGVAYYHVPVPIVCAVSVLISVLLRVAQFFSYKLWHFYLTATLIGTFQGAVVMATSLLITYYFRKQQALAFILLPLGGPFLTLTLPLLMRHVIDSYGFRYCFLVLGAFTSIMFIFSFFWTQTDSQADSEQVSERGGKAWLKHIRHTRLWLLSLCVILWATGTQPIIIYFVNYANSLGVPNSVFLSTLIGLGGLLGRIPFAVIGHFNWIHSYWLYVFALSLTTLSSYAMAYNGSYVYFCIMAVIFGFSFFNMIGPMIFLFQENVAGTQLKFNVVVSLVVQGIGNFLGSPLAGLVAEAYGYKSAICFAASLTAAGLIPLVLIKILPRIFTKCNQKRDTEGSLDDSTALQETNCDQENQKNGLEKPLMADNNLSKQLEIEHNLNGDLGTENDRKRQLVTGNELKERLVNDNNLEG